MVIPFSLKGISQERKGETGYSLGKWNIAWNFGKKSLWVFHFGPENKNLQISDNDEFLENKNPTSYHPWTKRICEQSYWETNSKGNSPKMLTLQGIWVTKVHGLGGFKREPWLKPYISTNTMKMAATKSEILKKLWKSIVHLFHRKTMEGVRNRLQLTFVNPEDTKKRRKQQLESTFTLNKIANLLNIKEFSNSKGLERGIVNFSTQKTKISLLNSKNKHLKNFWIVEI